MYFATRNVVSIPCAKVELINNLHRVVIYLLGSAVSTLI